MFAKGNRRLRGGKSQTTLTHIPFASSLEPAMNGGGKERLRKVRTDRISLGHKNNLDEGSFASLEFHTWEEYKRLTVAERVMSVEGGSEVTCYLLSDIAFVWLRQGDHDPSAENILHMDASLPDWLLVKHAIMGRMYLHFKRETDTHTRIIHGSPN